MVDAADEAPEKPDAADLVRQALEGVFASEQNLVAWLDAELRFRRVSRGYALACGGRDPAWFVGRGHFELFPHAENEAIFRRVLATGAPASYSAKPFEHPDQLDRHTTYWDWTLEPVLDANGVPRGLIFSLRDVTTQARALIGQRRAEAQLHALIEALPQGVCLTRLQKVLFANPSLVELLGYSSNELTGVPLSAFVDSADLEALAVGPAIGDRVVNAAPFLARLKTKQGELLETHGFTRVIDHEGEGALLHCFWDRTQVSRLERELRRSERLDVIGRLAGSVAHDINNLMTVVSLEAGSLDDTPGLSRVIGEPIAQILRATDSVAALTRQLLTFSREPAAPRRPLRLHALIDSSLSLARNLLPSRIRLVSTLRAEDDRVLADRTQLEQVVLNLVANARDAISGEGTIAVSTSTPERSRGGFIVLEVRDDGAGMDATTRARVFEPFFSTKAVGIGTGLGLAIVRTVTEQHGGSVEVESEPGEGALMRVMLPTTDLAPTASDRESRSSTTRLFGTETILLVEDDEPVRRAIQSALEALGYRVLATSDVDGALVIARGHASRLGLLLTDVVLGSRSGRELQQNLASMGIAVPTLFMSGYTGEAMTRLGCDANLDLISKPFTPKELGRRVRRALDLGSPRRGTGAARE